MTGEEGKGNEIEGGSAYDKGKVSGQTTTTHPNNLIVNQQRNGNIEKAPVVGGTNVETLPRSGKQVIFSSSVISLMKI